MHRKRLRPGLLLALTALLAAGFGCLGPNRESRRSEAARVARGERTTEELRASVGWLDIAAQDEIRSTLKSEELLALADRARAAVKPPVQYPKKNILVVTGGGSYGAYPAGVLVGWTASGTRPEFDVVTGISTGALIGAFAFLGPSEDCELQRSYTTLRNEDIFRRNRLIPAIFSESIADSAPLARLIERTATDERIRRFAEEHAKGRRFYVGTTDLDARRAIVWDMGAIAARGTPECHDLFRKVLLASASIPGFFPPVRITVTVDGRPFVERHIDGGTTSSMFFVQPWVPPQEREKLPPGWLYGSNVYILVAGKMYPDPGPVRQRTLAIASNAVSTIIYDQNRSDLHKLFMLTALTGMNYNVSVIPRDVHAPLDSTNFNPTEMKQLFDAGYVWALNGPRWRNTPPGYEPGEGAKYRSGTALTNVGPPPPDGVFGPNGGPIPPVVPEK